MGKSETTTTVTIIGAGYVGLTTVALFANAGYKVYVLEINQERLDIIKSGRSFFYEEYIDSLIKVGIKSKRFIPTDSYKKSIPNSDIVFSCVGTPDNLDGSSNLSYVMAAAAETAMYAKSGLVYVQKSTVPVGTGELVEQLFGGLKVKIKYVSNPEFLKEGTAVCDTLWPDRVVAGGSDSRVVKQVIDLHRHVIDMNQSIATIAGIPESAWPTIKTEYIKTNRNSAELIKVSANAFLALKISFANSIAKLADAAGADIVEIMNGVGSDSRIGRAFLNAGRGYGGGCFPKDVSGLISTGLDYGVDLAIMRAARAKNDSMPGYILGKAQSVLDGEGFANKKVALLGISFKAGTSDIRKSPALKIAKLLSGKLGAQVYVYDPQAFREKDARKHLHVDTVVCPDMISVLESADIAIIATDWPEFTDTPLSTYAQHLTDKVIIDAMNCLDPVTAKDEGLTYIGVGR